MQMVVLDEESCVEENIRLLHNVRPNGNVLGFVHMDEAEKYICSSTVDVILLNLNIKDGMEFAKRLKKECPGINLLLAADDEQYAMQAMDIHASGYILKPITEKRLRKELRDLRYHVNENDAVPKLFQVKTFGSFEAYMNHAPIKWQYNKTKELLAYLIDRRGTLASNGEIICTLWGDEADENKISYLKNIRSELIKVFEKAEMADAIVRHRGLLGICPS